MGESKIINRLVIKAVAFLLTACATVPSLADTYYASPKGGGDGRTESSPFQIADFWEHAKPGDTLLLLDGKYTGDRSMIRPRIGLKGEPGKPITVKALNDGRVEIDGEDQRRTVWLDGNDYFVLNGFNAHNAHDYSNNGSVVELSRSHHCIVRRVCAWDAEDSNTEIFGTHNAEHNLRKHGQGERTQFHRPGLRSSQSNTSRSFIRGPRRRRSVVGQRGRIKGECHGI